MKLQLLIKNNLSLNVRECKTTKNLLKIIGVL